MPKYYEAKVAADEVLTVLSKERLDEETKNGVPEKDRFCGISFRPGTLSDGPAGRVSMGKTSCEGKVARATVAEAIAAVLGTEGARGWIDLLDGEEEAEAAAKRIVKDAVDAVEGEDFEAMKERAAKL